MSLALAMLWHERNRYLPAVVAVGFSALLIVMQVGFLLGLFSEVATPVEQARADVWVGHPGVLSVDVTPTIPDLWEARLASQPGVERVETYLRGIGSVWNHRGGVELVTVLGMRLDRGALGPIAALTPELRARLGEPNTMVVAEAEMAGLGLRRVGDHAEINQHRVRLVGTIRWLKGMAGAYLFCSLATARTLLGTPPDRVSYVLGRCNNPADAPAIVRRLRAHGNMGVFTREELAQRSQVQWLTKSRAGVSLLLSALLGLLVGTGVTSQTLYAATAASARQYAVLEALGVPTRQMVLVVLTQSFWVGLFGVCLAGPAVVGCTWVVQATGGRIVLPAWVLAAAAVLTMAMALLSGLLALRSLRLAEPAILLR
jgi:putative ABC transport system permease protein